MGPLLFLLYINDIVNSSNILKFILFADDTNLFNCNNDFCQLILSTNNELCNLADWFHANKLSVNIKKTNYMLFGSKRMPHASQFQVLLEGQVLQQATDTKFLGVIIDDKLKWNKHIDFIALKLSKRLGIIGRAKNKLPESILKVLYYTLIYPYLNYCCIIWGSASTTTLTKVFNLQKRALRLITHSNYRTSSSPLYIRLEILKVTDIYKLQVLLFLHKHRNFNLPASCTHYCTVSINRPYEVRQKGYFCEYSFRTNVRERSIRIMGPRLWNAIPVSLQNCKSYHLFKRDIKTYLISFYKN